MAELQIDNHIFFGYYNDDDELIIKLENDIDLKFFKEWIGNRLDVFLKKDYVKDITIYKKYER